MIEGPEPKKPPGGQGEHESARSARRSRPSSPTSRSPRIRYLEDQRLLTPRRTPGGYRLYTANDVSRLSDDPAPAARRVPAAAGDPPGAGDPLARPPRRPRPRRRRGAAALAPERQRDRDELLLHARWTCSRRPRPSREAGRRARGVRRDQGRVAANGRRYYDDTEREIVRAVTELARYGVGGRNLPRVPFLWPTARPTAAATDT